MNLTSIKHSLKLRQLILISLITLLCITTVMPEEAFAYQPVPRAGIAINGQTVNSIDPIRLDNQMYLPLIDLAKILGYKHIQFERNTLTYEMTDGSTTVRATMGGTRARRGDELMNIDAPRWINETAYVTLDAGSALFNSYIYFKPENGSIQVQKPAQKYRVQSGDTLWRIAQAHHTTVQHLMDANDLRTHIIYPGQLLNLPKHDQAKEMEPIHEEGPVTDQNDQPLTAIRQAIIEEAKKHIGGGYKFGATLAEAPRLFDCSSYTQFVFRNQNITIPRNSRQQAGIGTTVESLQPGDLVFFTYPEMYSDGRVGHVGIYMGNGDMIHATPSRGVHITHNFMENRYWGANYLFAKRVIQ